MIDKDGKIVKSVFTSMTIEEISGVDHPAQVGARMSIMKRSHPDTDDDEDNPKGKKKKPFGKRALLLTPTDGHTHTLVDEVGPGARTIVGDTSWTAGPDGVGHSHPWVRNPDTGSFTIGEAAGHTHNTLIDASPDTAISLEKGKAGSPEPAAASKSNSGDSTADSVGNVPQGTIMSKPNEKTVEEIAVAKQLDELTKRAERAEKVAELNDAQRAIFTDLEVEGQDEFLGLSPDLREAQVAKAAEANAVVYTDSEGTEYRKSDDQRMVNLAKRADAERDLRVKGEEMAKAANLAKRAEGFKHIVGGVEAATLLLKGIDTLPEADQAPALEALGKQEAALAEAFVRKGTTEIPSGEVDELEKIAKVIQTSDSTLSPEQAMAKALETPEGSAAYTKSLGY